MKPSVFIPSLAILFLPAAILTAENLDSLSMPSAKDSVENLDKIVVTASRTKRLMSETPASVSVLSKSAIAASSAKSIEDLLITQTGIQAKRSVNIGEGIPADIIIRGIPGALLSPRTLILVDGIPTNATGTPFLVVNELPMEAIERIEIVRGPYSSLYGANAFGGVINIITKEGAGALQGGVNAETSYPFTVLDQYFSKNRSMATSLKKAGAWSYWNLNGTGSGGTDKFGVMASMGYLNCGNYLMRDSAIAWDGITDNFKTPDNHDTRNFRFYGKARYFLSDNSDVSLHVRYFNSDLGFGKTKHLFPDSMDIVTKGDRGLIGPQADIAISRDFSLHAGGFYRFFNGEFWRESDTAAGKGCRTYWNSKTGEWQAEAQGFLKTGEINTLTFGGDLLRNSADFGPFIDPATGRILPRSFSAKKAIVNGAAYVQDELKLFDRLNIVPVMRVDYHSTFGAAFSPKLGLSDKFSGMLRFHTSAGRSFRAPSLTELYLTDFPISESLNLKANPDLKPEYIWGYDAGFDLTPVDRCTFRFSGYYNSMTNLINQTIVSDRTSTYVTHRNIANGWSRGIEMELEWKPREWLFLSPHGTIQSSRDETYKASLDYVPEYMFGCQVRISRVLASRKMEGQIGFNFVGKRSFLDFEHYENGTLISTLEGLKYFPGSIALSSYGTLDMSYKIFLPKNFWLHAAVQNIFNTEYKETPGNLSPGRFATVKIGLDY